MKQTSLTQEMIGISWDMIGDVLWQPFGETHRARFGMVEIKPQLKTNRFNMKKAICYRIPVSQDVRKRRWHWIGHHENMAIAELEHTFYWTHSAYKIQGDLKHMES